MVEVNWAGIARTAKALGAEGTNFLQLRTSQRYDVEVLDAALPGDLADSPANGGWSAGPSSWLLLVEGPDEQVRGWIRLLAASLTAAGVEGTLTGAGVAAPPQWARRIATSVRPINACVGFHALGGPGFSPWAGWAAGPAARDAVVDMGMRWLSAHGGRIMSMTPGMASFWTNRATAALMLTDMVEHNGVGLAVNFDQARRELRQVSTTVPCGMTLTCEADGYPWQQTVQELRAMLLSAPLDLVSVAMVSHRSMSDYLMTDLTENDPYDRWAYLRHPEVWDEFVLEPNGIQILTDRHLEKALDLSEWTLERLDARHVLVQARDLAPWYGTARRSREAVDDAVMGRARSDFGTMLLTHERARERGLTG